MRGGYEACSCVIEWIEENIPEGEVILELGSGSGTTKILGEKYVMYSVEHNKKWCYLYKSTYIHATIKNGFYDTDVLSRELPHKYKMIIIDGPPSKQNGEPIGRMGFYDNLKLFDTKSIILFDDVNRRKDKDVLKKVCKYLNVSSKTYDCKCNRGNKFAVINFNPKIE